MVPDRMHQRLGKGPLLGQHLADLGVIDAQEAFFNGLDILIAFHGLAIKKRVSRCDILVQNHLANIMQQSGGVGFLGRDLLGFFSQSLSHLGATDGMMVESALAQRIPFGRLFEEALNSGRNDQFDQLVLPQKNQRVV